MRVAQRQVQTNAENDRSPVTDQRTREELEFAQVLESLKRRHKAGEDITDAALALICASPKLAVGANILEPLWRPLYGTVVRAEQRLVEVVQREPQSHDDLAARERELMQSCYTALGFLDRVYQRLYHLGNRSSGRFLLQRLQIFTGDVHRYHGRSLQGRERVVRLQHALTSYHNAWAQQPTDGLACNQIALVHEHLGHRLLACYFYRRAASCARPFPKAMTNFYRLLSESNVSPPESQASPSMDSGGAVSCDALDCFEMATLRAVNDSTRLHDWFDALQEYVSAPSMFDSTKLLVERAVLLQLLHFTAEYTLAVGRRDGSDAAESFGPRVSVFLQCLLDLGELSGCCCRDAQESITAAAECALRVARLHVERRTDFGLLIDTRCRSLVRVRDHLLPAPNRSPVSRSELAGIMLPEDRELLGVQWMMAATDGRPGDPDAAPPLAMVDTRTCAVHSFWGCKVSDSAAAGPVMSRLRRSRLDSHLLWWSEWSRGAPPGTCSSVPRLPSSFSLSVASSLDVRDTTGDDDDDIVVFCGDSEPL